MKPVLNLNHVGRVGQLVHRSIGSDSRSAHGVGHLRFVGRSLLVGRFVSLRFGLSVDIDWPIVRSIGAAVHPILTSFSL